MSHDNHSHQNDKNAGFTFLYSLVIAVPVIAIILFLNSSFMNSDSTCTCEGCETECSAECKNACSHGEEKAATHEEKSEESEEVAKTDSTTLAVDSVKTVVVDSVAAPAKEAKH